MLATLAVFATMISLKAFYRIPEGNTSYYYQVGS